MSYHECWDWSTAYKLAHHMSVWNNARYRVFRCGETWNVERTWQPPYGAEINPWRAERT